MMLPYDGDYLLYLAGSLDGNESFCDRGSYCPSCRLHAAHSQLSRKFDLPEEAGLKLLGILLHQVPDQKFWTKDECKELLRKIICNGQY